MYKRKLPNPVHIRSFQLAYICSLLKDSRYEITISPKADGIYTLFKYKSKYIFESEDMGNYKLAFDSSHYPIVHNDTLFPRSKWMRSLHPINFDNNYEGSTVNDIDEIIKYDNFQFKKFINSLRGSINKIEWFPKTTILIRNLDPEDLLKILDTKPNTDYGTDGWILTVYYKNRGKIKLIFGSPLKIKPKEDTTIDLFYNGNVFTTLNNTIINVDPLNELTKGIWRCNYDHSGRGWYVVCLRLDKYKPNNDNIVNSIIKYHQNPWVPSNIYKYIDNYAIYYPNNFNKPNISSPLGNFLSLRRTYIQFVLNKIINNGSIILDIGCGNGSILEYISHIKYNKYIGIDKDYVCLARCSKKIKHNDTVMWGDITQRKWNYFEDDLYGNRYDVIICINAIHYIDDKIKMQSFIENISKISKKGTRFLLITLDSTKMRSCDLSSDEDDFVIKYIRDNKFYFRYPWIGKIFFEIIPPVEELVNEIKNDWLETELQDEVLLPKVKGIYDQYNSFHITRLFTKIN